jgi:hypothetical protein
MHSSMLNTYEGNSGIEKREMRPSNPAAGNAGIASQLTIEHHWPGAPEPERQALAL